VHPEVVRPVATEPELYGLDYKSACGATTRRTVPHRVATALRRRHARSCAASSSARITTLPWTQRRRTEFTLHAQVSQLHDRENSTWRKRPARSATTHITIGDDVSYDETTMLKMRVRRAFSTPTATPCTASADRDGASRRRTAAVTHRRIGTGAPVCSHKLGPCRDLRRGEQKAGGQTRRQSLGVASQERLASAARRSRPRRLTTPRLRPDASISLHDVLIRARRSTTHRPWRDRGFRVARTIDLRARSTSVAHRREHVLAGLEACRGL